jgi:hypothetical protein
MEVHTDMAAHEDYEEYQRRIADCAMLVRVMASDADRRAMRLAAQRWRLLAAQAGKAVAESSRPADRFTKSASLTPSR